MIYSKCCYIWLHFNQPWKEKNACWIRCWIYQASWVMLTSQTLITWGWVKDYTKLFHLLEHKRVKIIFMCLSISLLCLTTVMAESLYNTLHMAKLVVIWLTMEVPQGTQKIEGWAIIFISYFPLTPNNPIITSCSPLVTILEWVVMAMEISNQLSHVSCHMVDDDIKGQNLSPGVLQISFEIQSWEQQ